MCWWNGCTRRKERKNPENVPHHRGRTVVTGVGERKGGRRGNKILSRGGGPERTKPQQHYLETYPAHDRGGIKGVYRGDKRPKSNGAKKVNETKRDSQRNVRQRQRGRGAKEDPAVHKEVYTSRACPMGLPVSRHRVPRGPNIIFTGRYYEQNKARGGGTG